MRARPHRALHATRPHVLPREGTRCRSHRRITRRRTRQEASLQEGRRNLRAHGRQPLLCLAAQGRAQGRRHHRPAVTRRLHRTRWLRGPEEGACHDARRDHHRSREIRPARQGRRRLPHRAHGAQPPATMSSPNTSSATATRATPAHSWTARRWRAARMPSSRA